MDVLRVKMGDYREKGRHSWRNSAFLDTAIHVHYAMIWSQHGFHRMDKRESII